MKTSEGHGAVLMGALKDFNAYWERTAGVWDDAARVQFERDYLQDLVGAVRAASSAIGQIEALLHTVRRDCS
jgi:hypothetical protein